MSVDLTVPSALADEPDFADVIEGALEVARGRGMSPARAARYARCTTAQARAALAWLAGHQHAHTGRHHPNRYYAGRAR